MKKKLVTIIALLGALIATPTLSSAGVESNGQMLMTFGRSLGDIALSEKMSGALYTHATVMIPARSTPQLYGYFGPETTIGNVNVKALTGLYMTADGGMSAIASLWYSQSLPLNLNLFLEGDAFIPIDGDGNGHELRQYLTIASISWMRSVESKWGVGIWQENWITETDVIETAVGPTLNFTKGSFWLAYDFTPAVEGDHSLILRLTVHL